MKGMIHRFTEVTVAACLSVAGMALVLGAADADVNEAPVGGVNAHHYASISAGGSHSCAVLATGGVKCWGDNASGQLGDGNLGISNDKAVPTQVVGLTSGVVAVASGYMHTCALLAVGTVKCWGLNAEGQLGIGTSTGNSDTPVDVKSSSGTGLLTGVTAISVGLSHTCAVLQTGALKCWGWNNSGQVGDNSQSNRNLPVDVVGASGTGTLTGVRAVSAGGRFTCALLVSGGVKCWGRNAALQLGDTTSTPRTSPVDVKSNADGTTLLSGVTAISAGLDHACVVVEGGGAKCWGADGSGYGELGDGTVVGKGYAVDVLATLGVGPLTGVTGISAGETHTCASVASGGALCWGGDLSGQIGDDSPLSSKRLPRQVSGLSSGVVAVSAGSQHSCALLTAGGVKCWGDNASGQVGDNTTTQRAVPVDVKAAATGSELLSGVGATTTTTTTTIAATSTTVPSASIRVKKSALLIPILRTLGVTVPARAKVGATSATKSTCVMVGAKVRGVKVGTCRLRVTITPSKTAQNPRPKITKRTITISIN